MAHQDVVAINPPLKPTSPLRIFCPSLYVWPSDPHPHRLSSSRLIPSRIELLHSPKNFRLNSPFSLFLLPNIVPSILNPFTVRFVSLNTQVFFALSSGTWRSYTGGRPMVLYEEEEEDPSLASVLTGLTELSCSSVGF